MAPAVAEQAHWFLWAMGLGAGLALVYDCLRELRRLLPQATIPADLAFLALAVFVLAYLGLALCHGRLQLFQLLGLATGAVSYTHLLIGVNMAVAVGNAVSMEISVVMKRLFPGRSGVIMCHRAFLFPESLLFFIIIAATPGQCKGGRGIFFPQCGIL